MKKTFATLCNFFFLSSLLLLKEKSFVGASTTQEGLEYLSRKEHEEGVVKLPSGLLYREIKPGKPNGVSPSISTQVECHYSGWLLDGTEFDSSYRRGIPLTLAPNQVIPGWTEALQIMTEGAVWELYIPSELGYGEKGTRTGSIPPNAVLVFQLELIKIKLPELTGIRRGLLRK